VSGYSIKRMNREAEERILGMPQPMVKPSSMGPGWIELYCSCGRFCGHYEGLKAADVVCPKCGARWQWRKTG